MASASGGYTITEPDQIQARWNLPFPPDLTELLHERRPLLRGQGSFNWLMSPPDAIQARLDWPFESFLFDVKHNGVWWPEWGDRPETPEGRHTALRCAFDTAPRLIPLFGHRCLPAEPCLAGNPVLSVHQTDIVLCGRNLDDWLAGEDHRPQRPGSDSAPIREIRFWWDALRYNDALP
ncbi:hypothetical protein [Zavarzinia sp.]|uniref:hypothetical protein n=1 Tax=Zavarzinia sp. TaxID=2027920 RepID=UPI003566E43B